MFARFSNTSFLFLGGYFVSIWVLHSIGDFYVFWVIWEFLIFSLMGIFFSSLTKSFSELFVYFIIQTISSFGLLFFFFLEYGAPCFVLFCSKIGDIPFHLLVRLCDFNPSQFFFFLMSAVIHKVPSFLIISLFGGVLEEFYGFLRLMFLLQTRNLIGGLIIATSIDYRIAIISSSVGNNSWFFLRVWARPFLFYAYFFFFI